MPKVPAPFVLRLPLLAQPPVHEVLGAHPPLQPAPGARHLPGGDAGYGERPRSQLLVKFAGIVTAALDFWLGNCDWPLYIVIG